MISGFDCHLNYAKVARAVSYLRTPGCLFVATNTDTGLPCGGDCLLPGTALLWCCLLIQESPAIADKPARCESLPKLLQFDVLTTLSLTILAYLYSFSCCCVRNLRNPAKFTENSNLWSLRSSKVIDLGVSRKPMYDFLLVTNSNFGRICYRFRDSDA